MDRDRAKIELREHLKEYLENKHGIDTSKNFRCLSPQHEDKNPSMGFDAAHNQAHCFSCNENYDILDLIQQDYNCDFNEALKIGCEMYHIQIDKNSGGAAQTNSAPMKKNAVKQPQAKQEQAPAVRDRLKAEFDAAQPANNAHPYLQAKHVKNDGTLKVNHKNELLISLRDVDGNFKGYQRIVPYPTKKTDKDTGREVVKWLKFQAEGTAQTGAFHVIGSYELQQGDTVVLAEGYATAFSIYKCIGSKARVVFALNCGNLFEVARAIHDKYDIKPFIAADIDKDGRKAVAKCREDICSGHVLPPLDEVDKNEARTDWNDYFTKYRLDTTKAALIDGLSKPEFLPVDEELAASTLTNLDINDFYIEFGERKNVKQIEMIGGLFPRGKISALIAPPGTGKTWFILYLSMYFSRGGGLEEPLLSRFPINRPYKSMILSGEGGYDELIGRSDNTGWRYDRQYLGVVDLNELIENDVLLSLTQEQGRRNLERLIDKRQPDIIFLDSLMAFSDYDENKSREMGELMKYLMQTARINDIAIVPVHHTRKRKLNERKTAQDMDEMIGSNMMQRYTRRIIGLQPKGQMIVEEVTGEEPVIVRDLKNNLTKKFKPFTFCITTDEDTNKLDMEFEFEPDLTFKAPDKKSEILHYIQENYAEGDDRFTRAELEQVFTAKSTLQKALKELVEAGKLGRCGENRSAEYFLRPEIVD
ncbi:MAG: AAA family ATPase [Synergistaceae bacterium]|nr:AAA family ATPase [Synergistaceae bacterium]MBR1602990.1 AAA family ATPase [Synergistaceae bacterium]